MLTVTESASAHLSQLLKLRDAKKGTAVRLVVDGPDVALQPDSERDGDTTYHHEGRTVLLLDAKMAQLLAEDTLDLEGTKLTLQAPTDLK